MLGAVVCQGSTLRSGQDPSAQHRIVKVLKGQGGNPRLDSDIGSRIVSAEI